MKPKRNYFPKILLAVIAGLLGMLIFKQKAYYREQLKIQKTQLSHLTNLESSIRTIGSVHMMSSVLKKVDEELNQSSARLLSDATINRLAALSYSFAPDGYVYLETDSLLRRNFNLERGQLLMNLIHMNIDSFSFEKIKQKVSFAGADLLGAQLDGAHLNGIDFVSANLKGANLNDVNFNDADLRGAVMWGAKLQQAQLQRAKMNRVDLSWADLDGANLQEAILKGVVMISTKLRNADLSNAIIFYANLKGSFFNGADLTNVNIFGSDLSNSVFLKANLEGVDFRRGNLSEAVFEDADMTQTRLDLVKIHDKDWFKLLQKWRVVGANEIQKNYMVVVDPSNEENLRLEIVK